MAEHDHTTPQTTPSTGRRAVLALAGAFSATGIVAGAAASVPQPSSDSELIRLCAKFDDYERQRNELFKLDETPEREAQLDALHELQEPMLDEISGRPPRTPEGWQALAATLVLWAPDYVEGPCAGWDDVLRATLLCGLLGRD